MGDYRQEMSVVSDKKRGVIPQKERNLPAKKKVTKHWTVYTWWVLRIPSGMKFMDRIQWADRVSSYNFPSEEEAVKFAEKRRRVMGMRYESRVWIANNEGLQEWRKAVFAEKSSNSTKT